MKTLLSVASFFGKELDWNSLATLIGILVIQAILLALEIFVIIKLISRAKKKSQQTPIEENVQEEPVQPEPVAEQPVLREFVYTETSKEAGERVLTGITLDVQVVQREFEVDEDFNCDGLVINAQYGIEGTESLEEYNIVNESTYARLERRNRLDGCYVIAPELDEVGRKVVEVRFGKLIAKYAIAVGEPAPEVVEEDLHAEPARMLLYVSLDSSNVQKEFTEGDALNHDGLVVYANYSAYPLAEEVTDYTVIAPDMNKCGKPTVTVSYQDKTVGYQITINPAPVVEEEPIVEEPIVEEEPVVVEEVVPAPQVVTYHEPLIVEEDSFDARLRYDRSFTARMIQAEDEVKNWYNELKNELLCYEKTKARMSWKRETFKSAKNVLAKLAFRGQTLCMYFPLDPNEYLGSEFPVEYVGEIPSNADTPTMIRLKNNKRVKLAIKLLAIVAKIHEIARTKHSAEDFYMPYEGTLDLINRGLIKREIKTAEDEAIFERDKLNEGEEPPKPDTTNGLTKIAPGVYVTQKK